MNKVQVNSVLTRYSQLLRHGYILTCWEAIARRAKGFDRKIFYTSRHRCDQELEKLLGVQFTTFEHLLQESDFVRIHTPLLDETYHLFGDCPLGTALRAIASLN